MSTTEPTPVWENATEQWIAAPYYEVQYQLVGFACIVVIFLVGMLGNVMVVIVVVRTRSMHTTTNCYLVSLAVADILTLVSAVLPTLIELFVIQRQHLFGGRVTCALMVFAQYLGVNASALTITAFSVERYIAICHVMRAQTICSISRATKIIAGVWIFGVVYCGSWLFIVDTQSVRYDGGIVVQVCNFRLKRSDYTTIFMSDLILFYIIPLIVNCVLYGLIARVLFAAPPEGSRRSNQSSTSSSRAQVIKMLAAVVFLFATLWMPYRVMVVYNSFVNPRGNNLWLILVCRIAVYLNSAINPILYSAMSVKFRRSFQKLLSCRRPNPQPQQNYTSISTMRHERIEMHQKNHRESAVAEHHGLTR